MEMRLSEELEARYLEVMVNPEQVAAARALKPMHEREVFGGSVLLFDGVDRQRLAALGDVRTPSIADLFVAVMASPRHALPPRCGCAAIVDQSEPWASY